MIEIDCKTSEEIASWFIAGTCELIPKCFSISPYHVHDLIIDSKTAPIEYSILCGSFEEFYIRPLNTCIADNYFLVCEADRLVFNGDSPMLPNDLSGLADSILCHKIESCPGYPGFVRLRVLGETNYN